LTTAAAVFWRICYALKAGITLEKGKETGGKKIPISLPEPSGGTEILQQVDTVKSTGFKISWNRYFISIELKSQTLHPTIHNIRKVVIFFRRKITSSCRMYVEVWHSRCYVCLFLARQLHVGQGLLVPVVSRSHTTALVTCTAIPRLTKIISSGITFVSRNVISRRFL